MADPAGVSVHASGPEAIREGVGGSDGEGGGERGVMTNRPDRRGFIQLTMRDQPFHESVVARLSTLGVITSRPLFGGHGLYWRETIFAILFRDRLYLKVDEQSKGDYLTRGMGPFRPNERQTLKSYFRLVFDTTK